MLKILSKEEEEQHRKELMKFVKENRCDMYNYMRDVKGYREQGRSEERVRIINVIGKLKLDKKVKEKVYDAIMKQPQKKYKEYLKRINATVETFNQDNQ